MTTKQKASICYECKQEIDWDNEGGIIWAGDTFCESCDPLEPVLCGDHLVTLDQCNCRP